MTSLAIELPDEQKAALAAKAQARGLPAEQYARQVLEHDLVPEWFQNSWETSREAGSISFQSKKSMRKFPQPARHRVNPG